ncbi:MAG: ribosome-associated translation inhibitor RaiA [Rhodobacteraceae bacterium]|nr:ribosome-associated translation inhibitor RaiA [Paracoccaceae bacterium]
MQIQVSGKHMDVGQALTTHVNEHLISTVGKYFDRPVEAHVTFSKDGHEFVANTMVHLATGMIAKASGHNDDVYASFDTALSKMEKQLRRYKRRLKDHHKDRIDPIETIGAPTFVIETPKEDEEPENLQPLIVAEMETSVQTLSVGEAVMQMELMGATMLVFRNVQHGGVNVVHTRDDGNVGWIDPRNSK